MVSLFDCYFTGGRAASAPELRREQWAKVTMAQADQHRPQVVLLTQRSEDENLVIFHAGSTVNHKSTLVNTGGRVLGVTALADSLEEAREQANAACEAITLPGSFYRSDIGCRMTPAS